MGRIYFLVSFVIWYIWLGLMPVVGISEPHKSLRDIVIGKISYGLMLYYIYMHGVIIDIVDMSRGP